MYWNSVDAVGRCFKVAQDSAATIARAASSREVRLREGLACNEFLLNNCCDQCSMWLEAVMSSLDALFSIVYCI